MLANRAARGLASLYVQTNQLTLQQAGRFHAQWTPRGWSDPASELVAFEQLLYLRQPGYGTSYITGKFQFERLISDYAAQQQAAGKPFSAGRVLRADERGRDDSLHAHRDGDGARTRGTRHARRRCALRARCTR